ncbi:MAG: restriction endonuclease subunit S [Candidatus Peribacter sp.]|nr:restriction endonuclease subunit S [Candidatus Peribacter sp.]
MKSGWQTKTLGELYQIGSSKRVLKSQWESSGVPFYRGREITRLAMDGYVDNQLFISERHFAELSRQSGVPRVNDILITAIGTIGNTYIVRKNDRFYFKDASVLWMKRSSDVDSEFIRYWLMSYLFFEQLDKGNGATVDTLTIQKLQNVKLHIPTSEEQKRIVSILDESFEAIEKAKENAERNLQNANELFESYLKSVFVHLGEKCGKEKFGEVCTFVRGPFGGSLKKAIFKKDGYAVYEQQHAINNQFVNIRYFIDENKFKEMKRFELHPGELIMSCSGTMGKVAIVPDEIKRGVINQALLKLAPSKRIINVFLKYWMESQSFQDSLKEYSQGAAIKNVASVKVLKSIKIPLPALSTQQSIVAKLDELSEQSIRLESIYMQKLADLAELKQSLLSKAFAGGL